MRRSRAGGKRIKGRRRKAPEPKTPQKSKRRALLQSSADGADTEVAELRLELKEVLDQQTATSDVLSVISSASSELDTIFRTILAYATRLCEAKFASCR